MRLLRGRLLEQVPVTHAGHLCAGPARLRIRAADPRDPLPPEGQPAVRRGGLQVGGAYRRHPPQLVPLWRSTVRQESPAAVQSGVYVMCWCAVRRLPRRRRPDSQSLIDISLYVSSVVFVKTASGTYREKRWCRCALAGYTPDISSLNTKVQLYAVTPPVCDISREQSGNYHF